MKPLEKDQFIGYLRSALHNLYYPDQLRQNPLIELFGVGSQFNAASVLQHILIDTIEKLKPGQNEPPLSRSWRIYDALFYRYVRQFDRDLVAGQLGISGRQLRREQKTALEAFANLLWDNYCLEKKIDVSPENQAQANPVIDPENKLLPEELLWLKHASSDEPTPVKVVLESVLELVKPLAAQFNVHITYKLEENLPELNIPSLVVRHTLLTLLSESIPRCIGKELVISIYSDRSTLRIDIDGQVSSEKPFDASEGSQTFFSSARHLVHMFDGVFTFLETFEHFFVKIIFPAVEKEPVMLIDDNPDALHLLQRYTVGTRFSLSGIREPDKAISAISKMNPRLILLDLMMPGVDGWQVLSQIRLEPNISAIPVVVVSILPQESLAFALGANAFLQKPINQKDLLELFNLFIPAK